MNKDEGQNLLVIGAPEHDANAYHLSGFLAPDAVICLRVAGKRYLAVSSLEYGRAAKSATVAPTDTTVTMARRRRRRAVDTMASREGCRIAPVRLRSRSSPISRRTAGECGGITM